MACIPIVVQLTSKPVVGLDEVGSQRIEQKYKKGIRANYLKKYHTSDDLFHKFRLMLYHYEIRFYRNSLALDLEKLVWRYL